jgi:hypothetical protein
MGRQKHVNNSLIKETNFNKNLSSSMYVVERIPTKNIKKYMKECAKNLYNYEPL